MTAKEYQATLLPQFRSVFPQLEVISEWRAFVGLANQYSPRVDIALGPFSTSPGSNLIPEYDRITRRRNISRFLRAAFNCHIQNLDIPFYHEITVPRFDELISKNRNSRCFLAVEIENTNSKKHMMGSIVNACSLGRIGIGIGYCPSALQTILRILNYLSFLKRVGKTSYDTANFLVLSVEQFDNLMN